MAVYVDMANAQFENANALRMYPFAENASLVDRQWRDLPRDAVVDVRLVVPSDSAGRTVSARLRSVHLSQAMVSACFVAGFNESGTWRTTGALSATVAAANLSPYTPVRLERLAGSCDIGGVVTFGDVELPGSPETYFLDGASVHPCCVASARPCGLRRIVDQRSGEALSGDVDIAFSNYVSVSRDGGAFTLSLDDGAADELASDCAKASGPDSCGATPITSINGVRPDEDGNIVLWFH